MTPREVLHAGGDALGVRLEEAQLEQLLAYVALLEKWNRVYNLTAIRDPATMLTHHILDSLAIVPHIPDGSLLDVGTGPGLPGIPVAIAQSERPITLLDSNEKKTVFARQSVATLRLANVSVRSQRVEDAEGGFQVIVSRAFAELRVFVEACARLLAPGGVIGAMKGVYPQDEVAGLPAGYAVQRVIPLSVPGLDAERHLLLIGAV